VCDKGDAQALDSGVSVRGKAYGGLVGHDHSFETAALLSRIDRQDIIPGDAESQVDARLFDAVKHEVTDFCFGHEWSSKGLTVVRSQSAVADRASVHKCL